MSTLSNHRLLALRAAFFETEPDTITLFSGSVLLTYGDEKALVRRSDWQVYQPFDPREAEIVQSYGVADRAKKAGQAREGLWMCQHPGPEFKWAQAAFRQRLSQ